MDFRFSQEEEAFRQEVRDFLEDELTPEFRESLEGRSWSKEFTMKMGAKGWLSMAWPKEYGGQGRSHMEQLIFNEEMARYKAPIEWHRRASQQHGFAIMLFGTEEQKKS
jgi:alkylation response protein AidB-like acyl-CoA dehydrogenase